MAIRTTDSAVTGIIEVDVDIPLTPFIETANNLVDRVCVNSEYSDATLELIERWLSAHFYATRDPRASMERAGSVEEQFEGSTKVGLSNTRYGQQALLLDTAGNLALLDQGRGRVPIQLIHIGGCLTDPIC